MPSPRCAPPDRPRTSPRRWQWQGARSVRGAGNTAGGYRYVLQRRRGQVETFGGGNPDLKEETADTFTVGLVLDSPWEGAFANLRGSVDYYSIKLNDAIFSVPAGEIVLLCYGYAATTPIADVNDPACRSINRLTDSKGNPSDGTPWVPSQGTSNVSSLEHGRHRLPGRLGHRDGRGREAGSQPDGQLAAEVGDRLSTVHQGHRLQGHHRRQRGLGAAGLQAVPEHELEPRSLRVSDCARATCRRWPTSTRPTTR